MRPFLGIALFFLLGLMALHSRGLHESLNKIIEVENHQGMLTEADFEQLEETLDALSSVLKDKDSPGIARSLLADFDARLSQLLLRVLLDGNKAEHVLNARRQVASFLSHLVNFRAELVGEDFVDPLLSLAAEQVESKGPVADTLHSLLIQKPSEAMMKKLKGPEVLSFLARDALNHSIHGPHTLALILSEFGRDAEVQKLNGVLLGYLMESARYNLEEVGGARLAFYLANELRSKNDFIDAYHLNAMTRALKVPALDHRRELILETLSQFFRKYPERRALMPVDLPEILEALESTGNRAEKRLASQAQEDIRWAFKAFPRIRKFLRNFVERCAYE
jgi:hypothetical protein